jgi:hypothetical protein
MSERIEHSYGTINWELVGSWLQLQPESDGPIWALNLMKYHQVARYSDERQGVTGREADDAYAPFKSLAAVGAAIEFVGNVTSQPLGDPQWDRVAVVRYPSRAAFIAMQERSDFKQAHEHKAAGMESTIILSCEPSGPAGSDEGQGQVVLVIDQGGEAVAVGDGLIAKFEAEGVIIGDQRTYQRATFLRRSGAVDDLVAAAAATGESFVVTLDPFIDQLAASLSDTTA